MKQFSILTVLLVTALIGTAIGWWVDHKTAPEVFYLHVYTPLYQPNQDFWHPEHESTNQKWINTRIGSVAVSPDIPFYYHSPIDRNPDLKINGTVTRTTQGFNCDFTIWIDDMSATFDYRHQTPVKTDSLVEFWNSYSFAITTDSSPYSIDYDVE